MTMLLPFNFIGDKEIMKLLRNLRLIINLFSYICKWAFHGLRNKKTYNRNIEVII
jgi:hypothetical protein